MDMTISMQSMGGHTEIEFKDDKITLEWRETDLRERKGLVVLVEQAKKGGFKFFSVGDDGVEEELTEKAQPVFFGRAGKLLLKGAKTSIDVIAKGLIEDEIKNGKLVMELTKDNEWRILRAEQFLVTDEKKKVVVASKPAGG